MCLRTCNDLKQIDSTRVVITTASLEPLVDLHIDVLVNQSFNALVTVIRRVIAELVGIVADCIIVSELLLRFESLD